MTRRNDTLVGIIGAVIVAALCVLDLLGSARAVGAMCERDNHHHSNVKTLTLKVCK